MPRFHSVADTADLSASKQPPAPRQPNTWHDSAYAGYLRQAEQRWLDLVVPDFFGFYAVQLGSWPLAALAKSRMQNRWTLDDQLRPGLDVLAKPHELPFAAESLDLLVLPHTLEGYTLPQATPHPEDTPDPQTLLREAHRVLIAQGRLVITGFNPHSAAGYAHRLRCAVPKFLKRKLRNAQAHNDLTGMDLPVGDMVAFGRLKDWLKVLGFEIELGRFLAYTPPAAAARRMGAAAGNALGQGAQPQTAPAGSVEAASRSERTAHSLQPTTTTTNTASTSASTLPESFWTSGWEAAGDRWWPAHGAVYAVVARKKVQGVKLVGKGIKMPETSPRVALARKSPVTAAPPAAAQTHPQK